MRKEHSHSYEPLYVSVTGLVLDIYLSEHVCHTVTYRTYDTVQCTKTTVALSYHMYSYHYVPYDAWINYATALQTQRSFLYMYLELNEDLRSYFLLNVCLKLYFCRTDSKHFYSTHSSLS